MFCLFLSYCPFYFKISFLYSCKQSTKAIMPGNNGTAAPAPTHMGHNNMSIKFAIETRPKMFSRNNKWPHPIYDTLTCYLFCST